MREHVINQPITLPFVADGLATGLLTFSPALLIDGLDVVEPSFVFLEIGGGLYTVTFTPTTTGVFSIFIEGKLLPEFQVVSKLTQERIKDLEEVELGSWTWDKSTGSLTLIRQDSSTLATFQVVDTVESASRERIS